MKRYYHGKPTKGLNAWKPLSTQYAKEFRAWIGIGTRKYQENYKRLDPLWDEDLFWDFELFLEEVGTVFSQSSIECSLDRIDNNKGYVRGNLRWATRSQQMRNKRSNGKEKYFYKGKNLREWEAITGVSAILVRHRIRTGWTIEHALFTSNSKTTKNVRLSERGDLLSPPSVLSGEIF